MCIFYLVLRGMDTIEDDMTIPPEKKIPLLKQFYSMCYQRGWIFTESGPDEKDRQLLVEFDRVIDEFINLKPQYQRIIADITMRMGAGMAEFVGKREVETLQEWDRYCHYVAGLVGIGLSQLFAASNLEDPAVGTDTHLANSMGLFLQKTNIIRDYLEDVTQGRTFWPREVWSKHADHLADLKGPENRASALACLNELITNALQHVPDVFAYMKRLRNQSVFNFCAIPQVMAIATLALCYDNYGVFTGVVKIRRGLAVKLMMESTSFVSLIRIFTAHTASIEARIPAGDPLAESTRQLARHIAVLAATETAAGADVGPLLPVRRRRVVFIAALLTVTTAVAVASVMLAAKRDRGNGGGSGGSGDIGRAFGALRGGLSWRR